MHWENATAHAVARREWVANSVKTVRPPRPGTPQPSCGPVNRIGLRADLRHRGLPQHVGASWSVTCGPASRWWYPQADGPDPQVGAQSGLKSDPIDALAVARAVLRETDLPWPPGRDVAGVEVVD